MHICFKWYLNSPRLTQLQMVWLFIFRHTEWPTATIYHFSFIAPLLSHFSWRGSWRSTRIHVHSFLCNYYFRWFNVYKSEILARRKYAPMYRMYLRVLLYREVIYFVENILCNQPSSSFIFKGFSFPPFFIFPCVLSSLCIIRQPDSPR